MLCCKQSYSLPKVSVIVPAYNTEDYIASSLHSLIAQTLKEIEIIVVDDGSTDSTASKVREIAGLDARIKFFSQSNQKQGAARNRGIEIATGEYIGFVDSDDWVSCDYFEKLYNAARKYDADIALATNVRIGNGKTKKRLNIESEVFVQTLQDRIDISKQAKNPCPTNKIYRRELLLGHNIFYPEGIYCEDKLFTMQSLYYANGLVTVPETFYYYFRNPHSTVLSSSQSRKDKNHANLAVLQFLRGNNVQLREGDFSAISCKKTLFGIPFFAVKETLNSVKYCSCGIKILEKDVSCKCDYKRKKIKIFGMKFTCKSKEWLKKANESNIEHNLINLAKEQLPGDNNILFVASHFVKAGGIETRLMQYIEKISAAGWNCYILSENNENASLGLQTNFTLNFDGSNFGSCLDEIIEKFKINVVEFQFKNPKILKNLDLEALKSKVKLGCVIHNTGVKNFDIINRFDYKIVVSNILWQRHYTAIKDVDIIQNCVDSRKYENAPVWKFAGQKKAVLITRIAKDKVDSIECFIKYCQERGIDFEIAGDEVPGKHIKRELIEKYHLAPEVFIGKVNTWEYLSENTGKILFAAGVGLVILEAGYLNYPCLCCSESKGRHYSFVTLDNVRYFDNFTINGHSPVVQKNACEFEMVPGDWERYRLRDYVIGNRDLAVCVKKYIDVISRDR